MVSEVKVERLAHETENEFLPFTLASWAEEHHGQRQRGVQGRL